MARAGRISYAASHPVNLEPDPTMRDVSAGLVRCGPTGADSTQGTAG